MLTQFIFQGEKKRDAGGTNEIVACTNCGGGSNPCTHSANNGCATEVILFGETVSEQKFISCIRKSMKIVIV